MFIFRRIAPVIERGMPYMLIISADPGHKVSEVKKRLNSKYRHVWAILICLSAFLTGREDLISLG